MLLLDRWRRVLEDRPDAWALSIPAAGRTWTFSQLDAEARQVALPPGPIVFATGSDPSFVFRVLRSWQLGRVLCPLESGQSGRSIQPPPEGIVHLKTTSATSGPSKLVAFTASQLAADADNIVSTMGLHAGLPNLGAVSLAHSYGFSNLVLPLLLHGIPLILAPAPLPEPVRVALVSHPGVALPSVPALWKTWLEAGILGPQIHLAISAGAPLPLDLERAIHDRHGIKVHNFYGASECGGIAYDRGKLPRVTDGFAGQPMDNVSLSITEDGCLRVASPAVAEGYWPEPAPGLAKGLYTTSDLADLNGHGVVLRGRAGDWINVAGRKLHPGHIESALQRHPAVVHCLVFGVPDSGRSERVVAVVRARDGCSQDDLRAHALANLEDWQVPKEWWLSPDLQPDPRGKLSRSGWRERFMDRTNQPRR